MMKTEREDNRRKWEDQVLGWRSSGVSKREYCRRANLSYTTFLYWSRQLRRSGAKKAPAVIRLGDIFASSGLPAFRGELGAQNGFRLNPVMSGGVPIGIAALKLWVGEYRIDVGDRFSEDTLDQLIRVLRRG